eukprot:CAMPEP_0115089878 /NCGR_PEP_ID=MMETSP0227-20121206/25020_1 /TAXON_ID=89957 /ORGANISM="Polarella glacialis, Strain CCMP 1383" /LENGTH=982 /DNA_ID=CAMNT_0002480765 /DNA_START=46 /DNA_END=2994 /DNA_ORIENTATION=-
MSLSKAFVAKAASSLLAQRQELPLRAAQRAASSVSLAAESVSLGQKRLGVAALRRPLPHSGAGLGVAAVAAGLRAARRRIAGSSSRRSSATVVAAATSSMEAPTEILRQDYTPPNYWIREAKLAVRIFPGRTEVSSRIQLERREGVSAGSSLSLDGESLKLQRVVLNGKELAEGAAGYMLEADKLTLSGEALLAGEAAGALELEISVEVVPEENTQLSGLYYSGSMYCTQMEAEGFRRFTYFLDRPDNMAKFTEVRIEADEVKCPVLLSNGNRIEAGKLDGGRHYSVWTDPFAKPSYLFALVAGDLDSIQDKFVTMSGRSVHLEIFAAREDKDQLWHSMRSLQKSMKWDEDRYGLEYDLDIYNIVAVKDFNMGAMENKSLNVFNTSLTLARPDTATDDDYERIESVIGHEYFHNWTGNRVTCRDWFQLTLKEGLTVYRDQEFSSDLGSRAKVRIENVRGLRAAQFPEDSSPMAHSIRPEKYAAIDNFYTATVYMKGAEVIRMYETLVGRDGFRKGMDLYFKRHDGSAVSCDDFRAAMADANGRDLTQFERWYLQAGTPVVTATDSWDAASGSYTLHLKQTVPDTPGQDGKLPMLIPVRVGLLDRETGAELLSDTVLELTEVEQTFTLKVSPAPAAKPVPSLLRDFSAPVRLEYAYSNEDLALLAGNDTDSFNRWEAMQRLGTKAVLDALASPNIEAYQPDAAFVEAMRLTVTDRVTDDLSLIAYALVLPTESTLGEVAKPPLDPTRLHAARNRLRDTLGAALRTEMRQRYDELVQPAGEPYVIDGPSSSRRRLKNVLLGYLSTTGDAESLGLCAEQFSTAGGLTDKSVAFGILCNMPDTPQAKAASEAFFADAKGDSNVIDKWFAAQARADVDDLLPRVRKLMEHPEFTMTNPNRLRSVTSVYLTTPQFHQPDGKGYEFATELIQKVDALNPQVSARLASSAFRTWRKYDEPRQKMILAQLEKLSKVGLSKDALEIVSKMRA